MPDTPSTHSIDWRAELEDAISLLEYRGDEPFIRGQVIARLQDAHVAIYEQYENLVALRDDLTLKAYERGQEVERLKEQLEVALHRCTFPECVEGEKPERCGRCGDALALQSVTNELARMKEQYEVARESSESMGRALAAAHTKLTEYEEQLAGRMRDFMAAVERNEGKDQRIAALEEQFEDASASVSGYWADRDRLRRLVNAGLAREAALEEQLEALREALDKGRRFERGYQESLGATPTATQYEILDNLQSAFLDAYIPLLSNSAISPPFVSESASAYDKTMDYFDRQARAASNQDTSYTANQEGT